jgi:hypothetical protein
MEEYLSCAVEISDISAAACFMDFCGQSPYAHAAVVAPSSRNDAELLHCAGRVILLYCADEAAGTSVPDGIFAVSFSKNNYQNDLYEMEL